MKCSKQECKKEAVYGVGLLLRSKMDYPSVKTGYMQHRCEEHKDATWEEVVDKYGWESIKKNFQKRKVPVPRARISEVYVEPLTKK